MIEASAILWGLMGAVLIGASDCIARVTAQKISSTVLFLFIMGLSSIVLLSWQLVTSNLPPWNAYAWGVSAISGILNIIALFFLYKALARGPVTVASPAASTFVVLLVLLNIITGAPWNVWQLIAIGIVFFGIVQLSRHSDTAIEDRDYDSAWLRTTALYGLATAITITIRMYMAQEATDVVGALHALTLNRMFALATTLVLLVWLLAKQSEIVWPQGRLLRLVILQTAFETLALSAFLLGSASGGRVGATIGFSVFSATTALIAWWWLGERIGIRRGLWMLVVGCGVALASATSAL